MRRFERDFFMQKSFLNVVAFLVLLHSTDIDVFAESGKIMKLKKAAVAPTVDGIVESAWGLADSVSDFVQYQPYVGKEPSRVTVAKVLTTEEALYCLMVCYDSKEGIQQHNGKQDDLNGDVVSLMLDTFGDKRSAYKFAVSASGGRSDCRLLDDARNRDYSWDGVWFAAAKVYDWGFVVEIEVPYKSIQYNETLTEWGLDFDRWIPRLTEDIYWNPYVENEGQRISKFGTLQFQNHHPSVKGLSLEIYPVGIAKATYLRNSDYKVAPDGGLDVFYNPSQKLTYQLTANPDFAQIEADPFAFNISRYESYFNERRPFFTQGNEVFMPSGREQGTGFYSPLELFYSRRIGKKLPDGGEVPLIAGTKAFGRIDDWEYGGFLAYTGAKDFVDDGTPGKELAATFGSVRIKKQVFDNSSIGMLMVGKRSVKDFEGVVDIDGAFRSSNWQLSYQLARSAKNSQGDYAASAGLLMPKESWILFVRTRYIGQDFDINEVGYVPWIGTAEFTPIGGPRWYFKEGYVRSILLYFGSTLNFKNVERHWDHSAVLGFNMQLRDNWGYEITFIGGRSKDEGVLYDSREFDYSCWFNISPKWEGNFYGGYAKTYNFSREYLAPYTWFGSYFGWLTSDFMGVGSSFNAYVEFDPDQKVQDVTLNARPFVSVTPMNDLNIRMYVDGVFLRSSDNVRQIVAGFLFSYQFRPKSWIYFALNEVQDRSDQFDPTGTSLPNRLHITDRVSVLKLKYLYFF
jgi:hypothetical protein